MLWYVYLQISWNTWYYSVVDSGQREAYRGSHYQRFLVQIFLVKVFDWFVYSNNRQRLKWNRISSYFSWNMDRLERELSNYSAAFSLNKVLMKNLWKCLPMIWTKFTWSKKTLTKLTLIVTTGLLAKNCQKHILFYKTTPPPPLRILDPPLIFTLY